MAININSNAVVSKKAKLDEDCFIGQNSIIGDNVTIGQGTKIGAFCVIEGNTKIGRNCEIFTGAIIGSRPQDLKYKGEQSYLEIGDNNIIREYCTFNPGTGQDGKTTIGNGNLFMAYSHVAHDCRVGSNCIIANNGTFAGHVIIEDNIVIGGLVGIHQFVRVGALSIIGGCSKVIKDIPPYSTCDGHPARVFGLNIIGLRRQNISKESIRQLNHAFSILFKSGLSIVHAIKKLEKEPEQCVEVSYLIDFVKKSERGVSRSCRME